VRLETKECADCGLDLPLKQFAMYRAVRHPLCRTCLAIDVAEFKEWVLPFVEERRRALDVPYYYDDWEIAVIQRLELTGHQRAVMTQRPLRSMHARAAGGRSPRFYDPAFVRPWKFNPVGASN
jgi:hypothetical protein